MNAKAIKSPQRSRRILPPDIVRVLAIAFIGLVLCYWLIVAYAGQFRTGSIYLLMGGGAIVAIIGFTIVWGGKMR